MFGKKRRDDSPVNINIIGEEVKMIGLFPTFNQ